MIMVTKGTTVLKARALPNFVETKFVKEVTVRALGYIKAGFPFISGDLREQGKLLLPYI